PAGPTDSATAFRALVLAATAERLEGGRTALVSCPPGVHPPLVWHVHLAASAVLAIPDGRTIPLAPPPPSRAWTLSSGRSVQVADGGSERTIAHQTATVQVAG